MKFVKFSMLALTLGLFLASCGGGESTETPVEDTTTIAPVIEEPVAPVVPDTTVAPAIDTTTVAPAP